jgi:hypothetical protein
MFCGGGVYGSKSPWYMMWFLGFRYVLGRTYHFLTDAPFLTWSVCHLYFWLVWLLSVVGCAHSTWTLWTRPTLTSLFVVLCMWTTLVFYCVSHMNNVCIFRALHTNVFVCIFCALHANVFVHIFVPCTWMTFCMVHRSMVWTPCRAVRSFNRSGVWFPGPIACFQACGIRGLCHLPPQMEHLVAPQTKNSLTEVKKLVCMNNGPVFSSAWIVALCLAGK